MLEDGTVVSRVSQPSSGFPQAGNSPISPHRVSDDGAVDEVELSTSSPQSFLLPVSTSLDAGAWSGKVPPSIEPGSLSSIEFLRRETTISIPAQRTQRLAGAACERANDEPSKPYEPSRLGRSDLVGVVTRQLIVPPTRIQ